LDGSLALQMAVGWMTRSLPHPRLPLRTAKTYFSPHGATTGGCPYKIPNCTAGGSPHTFKVGVELFDSSAVQNNIVAGDGALNVAPGQTVSFTTATVAWLPTDQTVTSGSDNGSARIVAYSTKLLCTAKAVARTSPTVINTITIGRRRSRRAIEQRRRKVRYQTYAVARWAKGRLLTRHFKPPLTPPW
jgi:hypothetical protein